ncbi:MAG: ribosome small subunit-dependent GTPase A [bacterium]|nr:ribosome small subunit-dependent GTPase A [bacterium]
MEKLYSYGWNSYINQLKSNQPDPNNVGRVISIQGFKFHIISENGTLVTELMGQLISAETEEQPKVGDWVTFIEFEQDGFINEVLPRFNEFYRKSAGKESSKQILATNLDRVIVMQGLDRDFNIMRFERYLVQTATCGIETVVVLNKCDLCEDRNSVLESINALGRNVEVVFTSNKTGEGIETLHKEVLIPGETCLLIGSSGVGKSTLINSITDSGDRNTQETSEWNNKGKHTTTTRDMILLPSGAIIIDTPGMRELGVGFEEDSEFADQFPVIDEYARDCRYENCSHVSEEGCAVIEAYESGEISEVVYFSYLKLIKEQERFQLSTHEKKQQGKRFGKMVKEAKAHRKRYKY